MTTDEGRQALRIAGYDHDDEIDALIEAAKADLETAGIYEPAAGDPLYEHAIRNYLRGNFWPEEEMADKCMARYEDIKSGMKLTGRCTEKYERRY